MFHKVSLRGGEVGAFCGPGYVPYTPGSLFLHRHSPIYIYMYPYSLIYATLYMWGFGFTVNVPNKALSQRSRLETSVTKVTNVRVLPVE